MLCNEWKMLQRHHAALHKVHLADLFSCDSQRFEKYSLEAVGLLLDYSRNHINYDTVQHLCRLALCAQLADKIQQLFCGGLVNFTEKRAALHTALRDFSQQPIFYQGENIANKVTSTLQRMQDICHRLHTGQWLGHQGQVITDVVNIGIGGSQLGAAMAYEALSPYQLKQIKLHFISNVDGCHLEDVLGRLCPDTTLFIIASKSFDTPETILNTKTVKQWLPKKASLAQHMLAITAHRAKAIEFAIPEKNILDIWDWVGGRFSLWSAMGLPLAMGIGMDHFKAMLSGAHQMDQHFKTAPFAKNMPVLLAVLSIWYINFFDTKTHAILPYAQHLRLLPSYLQQLHMESNGKQASQQGGLTKHNTAPVLWGQIGSNGQHTFHQLLHQSNHIIPIDFIVPINSHSQYHHHHKQLVANCLSQSHTLMYGNEAQSNYVTDDPLKTHRYMPGNKPSNTLFLPDLTPKNLGALLALYEHKVFVQSVIWQINAFDQFGVELAKTNASEILAALNCPADNHIRDSSTSGLINYFHRHASSTP